MAQIRIDIASEFKEKGFKKASKSATALERQFKGLAKTFLAVFSTRQIIAFSRASIKAFEQDELAARRLTTTLNNLNLGFEDPRVRAFISDIEKQTGILDDELRPAMQAFLTTTGSVTKAQELLNMAINVSRGSSESLATVANDLSKAYVGNTKGLSKYNLGLTKTELQQKSFAEIQTLINKQFSGQNAAYLDTYAGRIGILKVAFANMQEEIGKGLVDSFTILAGKNGIPGAVNAMEDFSDQISNVIRGAAIMISYLERIPGMKNIPVFDVGNIPVAGAYLKLLENLGRNSQLKPKPFSIPMTISGQTDFYAKQDKIREQAEKDRLKREKELAALQKKAELERQKRERIALARKRAATIFDIENIQIVAALQSKVDGEQRARLVTMLAINTENYTAAEKLADIVIRLNAPALSNLGVLIESGDSVDDLIKKLITSQAKLAGLQLMAEDFPELENPFEEWNMTLDEILAKLLAMLELLAGDKKKTTAGEIESIVRPKQPNFGPGSGASDVEWMRMMDAMAKAGVPYVNTVGATQKELMRMSNAIINVNVAGNVTTERDLVDTITEQIYNQQKSGKQIVYSSTGL